MTNLNKDIIDGYPVHQIIEDAWLNVIINEKKLYNPLEEVPEFCERSELYYSWLLTRPEYLGFAAKILLNIDLAPFQTVILQQMWKHKFPMVVASRGAGKLLRYNEKVRVRNGWKEIRDIKVGDYVYGSDGKLARVRYKSPLRKNMKMYRITLKDNRTIDCCEDHIWKIVNKDKNKDNSGPDYVYSTMRTKEMYEKYFRLNKGKKRKSPKVKELLFSIPNNAPLLEEKESDLLIHPYVIGVLLSCGGKLNKRLLRVETDTPEIIDRLNELLPKDYTLIKSKYSDRTWLICREDENIPAFYKLCDQIGFVCDNKSDRFIPKEYKFSSYEQKLELTKGIMDGGGYVENKEVKYSTDHPQLLEDFQDVVRSLGMPCIKAYNRITINTNQPIFTLKEKLTYLGRRRKFDKTLITKIEKIEDDEGYCISVDNADHTYITKDYIVTHNTFILAVYSLLRSLLIPKRKVVIVGSVFRQSKLVFNYIKTIYDNSSILQSVVKDEPHFSNDRCHFTLGDSSIIGIPVGTGDKVRGLRASEILADEFACLSRNSLLQTNLGLIKIENYLSGTSYSLLNKDGEFEYPDTIFRTPSVDVYRVVTTGGYSFDCSEIHQFMTRDGWKKLTEAKEGDWLELDQNDYFPKNFVEEDSYILDDNLGWLIGALISKGNVINRNYIGITSTDINYLNQCKEYYPNDKWKLYTKEAFTNSRGWGCKKSYNLQLNDTELRTALKKMGVDYSTAREKTIPSGILQSPRSVVINFLKALMEGDGSCFEYKDRGKKRVGLSYYSGSLELVKTLQILLLKFGIFGSINKRSSKISDKQQWMISFRGKYAKKLYDLIEVKKFKDKIEESSFHVYKPFIREVTKKTTRYYLSTSRGNKTIYLGSFASKKEALEYFNEYENNSPIMVKIKSIKKLPEKEVLYDFHMPKTHSFVANGFIQHNSQSREIFETVIAGFGAVSSDPINQVKIKASQKFANYLGIELEEEIDEYSGIGNQIVLSGTAYYYFNHFAQYWEKWRKIINSKGDPKKLQEIFGDQEIDDGFDWRDYSVVRLPADLLPPGFMDSTQLARSKATLPSDTFNLEFNTIFSKDSNGFFKASLLEKCTANEENDITLPSGRVVFDAKVKGDDGKKYIIGVDPASEQDRFAVVILEIYPDHRRIVHVWTTNSEEFKAKRKAGIVEDNDFYGYTARKIRDLMILFPCVHLAIDSQGGGKAVYEALHDTTKLKEGELCLWEIIDPKSPKDSDAEEGLHVVEMVNFASAEYTSYANHSMKKDFEDKILLFPRFNPAISAIAESISKITDPKESINGIRLYDTFEDTIEEIEELKKELSQIVITVTTAGRERWDTPDVKISGSQKGKLRKDRYSALVMANAAARKMSGPNYIPKHDVSNMMDIRENSEEVKFIGPQWITSKLNSLY